MKNTRSNTVARYALMQRVLRGDNNIPLVVLKACKSQGGIAKLSFAKEGIRPMSLNTLKAASNVIFENGGWQHFNEMRLECLKVLGLSSRSQPGCHQPTPYEKLKEQKAQLETSLDVERRFRLRLQVAYDELLSKLRNMAHDDRDLTHYLNRHVAGYSCKRLSIVVESDGE